MYLFQLVISGDFIGEGWGLSHTVLLRLVNSQGPGSLPLNLPSSWDYRYLSLSPAVRVSEPDCHLRFVYFIYMSILPHIYVYTVYMPSGHEGQKGCQVLWN